MTKKYSRRYLRILSRHPSHNVLRKNNKGILCSDLAVLRLGSTTISTKKIQVNSIEGVQNSSDKLLMKLIFSKNNIPTAKWVRNFDNLTHIIDWNSFPIVVKHRLGSRGRGNTLITSQEQLEQWATNKNTNNYIFEKYYNYLKEYRLHVTELGCFYTCRKMLKSDATERWYRNDSNSVWMLENNPLFDKPITWNLIVNQCVKALKALKLDIAAFDVKVNKKGNFIILESNSAASLGAITEEKYRETLPKLVKTKALALKYT